MSFPPPPPRPTPADEKSVSRSSKKITAKKNLLERMKFSDGTTLSEEMILDYLVHRVRMEYFWLKSFQKRMQWLCDYYTNPLFETPPRGTSNGHTANTSDAG